MKLAALVVVTAILITVLAALTKKGKNGTKTKHSQIKARDVLTKNEQAMYFRLVEALPGYTVLCQVAFSALVDTRLRATRNTFDRKVADFVICRKSFGVVTVIELDDSSHNGREKQDRDRDEILKAAGYRVLRYKRIPDAVKVREDIKALFSNDAITTPPPNRPIREDRMQAADQKNGDSETADHRQTEGA